MHLHSVLRGAHAFLLPTATLDGISEAVAMQRPQGASHSIAEIVAHMALWQDWFLDRCDGRAVPGPRHAALGWPAVGENDWERVLARFHAGFTRALGVADDDDRTKHPIVPALEADFLARYTQGDALIHISLHNAHHLGQIITLRQQLGAWPPSGGGWTW